MSQDEQDHSRFAPYPEQDHRGIKQRIRPMGGFKSVESATRFCRAQDEARTFLRPRSRRNEVVSLAQRRLLYTARTRILLTSWGQHKREH